MEDGSEDPYISVPNKGNKIFGIASLILGLFSCATPYLLLLLFSLGFAQLSKTIGPDIVNLLEETIPLTVSLIGLAAIVFGLISIYRISDPVGASTRLKATAVTGIIFGISTVLFVTFPLILLDLIIYFATN